MTTSPIIDITTLTTIQHLENLVLLDARSGSMALTEFENQHLVHAQYVDLDKDLACHPEDPSSGGRHPLPSAAEFSKTISKLGINTESHVVIYDDAQGTNAAARLWWMLRAAGLTNVQVLNGGLKEALKHGYPTESGSTNKFVSSNYSFDTYSLPLATMTDVQNAAKDKSKQIIDVRAEERYLGKHEPIDLIAGHIPNAINIPFTENLNSNGLFLSPQELHNKYIHVFQDTRSSAKAILHCGSGVTACHSILALAYAGFDIPALYNGSWSEWSRNNNVMILKV